MTKELKYYAHTLAEVINWPFFFNAWNLLTETSMMLPHASACRLFFGHPNTYYYFGIGRIGEDQFQDYALLRNLPIHNCANSYHAISNDSSYSYITHCPTNTSSLGY